MNRGQSARRAASMTLGVLATTLATVPSCKKPQSIGLNVSVPSDAAANAAWYEVAAFKDTTCASLGPLLGGGVPQTGAALQVAFAAGGSAPSLGQLPRGKYAFAGDARAADCSVIAVGCDDVDFTQTSSVNLSLDDVASPGGACAAGSVCDQARCVPGTDNSNPSVGAGCSLDLLGAGPLTDPITPDRDSVSAPAVAVTSTGFLVAYREYDPDGGIAQLTFLPLDTSGGALPAQPTGLMSCISATEDDATGLAFGSGGGTAIVSRPACGVQGGFDVFQIDGTGTVQHNGFNGVVDARVDMSTSHSVAIAPGGSDVLVAFLEAGDAHIGTVNGLALGAAAPRFSGGSIATGAWVTTSDKAIALLALTQSPLGGGTDDAGLDGSDEGGTVPPGPGGSSLELSLVAASTPLGTLGTPIVLPGATWGSVALQAGRAIVVSDGGSVDMPVVYRTFDLGDAQPGALDGFATEGNGAVQYTDVAIHQDHAFFAVERAGAISLVAYDHATTTPTFLREIVLGADPRIPSVTAVRDGRIAVAASDTRVVVAWTTGASLTTNDATGGYAVFACTTP